MKACRLAALLALLLAVSAAAVFYAGERLSAPVRRAVGPPPAGLGLAEMSIPGRSGNRLAGWFALGRDGAGAVVLLHPLRADRRSMIGRARFLWRAGYSVLAFDFQAHGDSPGERITFGHLESQDAAAAVAFMREKVPGERIGVIGVSLGGAAAVLARPALEVDAVVLESVYPTIAEAVENRLALHVGAFARPFAPLLLQQLPIRLGIDLDELAPVDAIGGVRAPVLLIAGGRDRRTTPAQSRALYASAPSPKELWILPGAKHEDFHAHAAAEYERRVLAFLRRHLRR